ncbi:MAG: oligopeptide transport system ATP-binding protein [Candidatus Latescibacterota bacterium]|jgi:oligopeptide transport system ATP-binding protein
MVEPTPLLKTDGLTKHFTVNKSRWGKEIGQVRAVDGVSLDVYKGETLGVVGESGCGKTTLGRLILRLIEPTAGQVHFAGENVGQLSGDKMRAMRRRMQIIFQDPYSSLNPRMTVHSIIAQGIVTHGLARGKGIGQRVGQLLEMVGLPANAARRYPHEFSGGQRQRIGIARALAVEPEFIVADEPVSALDVSVQAQIVNLLQDIQEEMGLTYMFIAHDLGVVRHISDRVAVMYLGKVVELAPKALLYKKPSHPYTQALLSAVPIPDPKRRQQRIILEGDVPNPADVPSGCPFHPRCAERQDQCKTTVPQLIDTGDGRQVACLLRQPASALPLNANTQAKENRD